MATLIDSYFFNDNTYVYFIITSFAVGLIFSPFSLGLESYIFYAIASELLIGWATKLRPPYWLVENRAASISAGFLGFFVGRLLVGFQNITDNTLLPEKKKLVSKRQLQMFLKKMEEG